VANLNVNVGGIEVKGWDFEANYQADLADWNMGNNGSLAFNFAGTWMTNYDQDSLPGIFPVSECAGTYGCALLEPQPKWRHKLRVTWSTPWDFDISGQWRRIGEACHYDGIGAGCDPGLEPFDSIDYFDLAATWHVWENVELRGGVNNIFDKDPPFTAFAGTAPGNGNTFPGTYDALGRYVFIAGTVKM
jgi:outer membrane receptor protein involved in Fe transport